MTATPGSDKREPLSAREWEIVEAIRFRDGGRPDGTLADLFVRWAHGEVRIQWDIPRDG